MPDLSKPGGGPDRPEGRSQQHHPQPGHPQPGQAQQGQSQQGGSQQGHSQQGQSQQGQSQQGQAQQGRSQTQFQRLLGPRGSQSQSQSQSTGRPQSRSQGRFGVPVGTTPDLAANAPGTACVERAREMRSTAPIKSRAERLLGVSRTPEARLRATAVAEKKVATLLERLPPGWRVLHSVPVGPDRPEVSHLVIGPAGVFTLASRVFRSAYRTRPGLVKDKIEAQVINDSIRIYGETMPWVAEARAQAWRTARALTAAAGEPVYVRPAVILMGVDVVRIYKPADRVEVLTRNLVLKWLERFPHELRATSVDRIYAAARRAETWVDPRNALSTCADTATNPTIILDKPAP